MEVHSYENSHALATPKLLSVMICISFFLLIPFATPTIFDNTNFQYLSFDQSMGDITYEGNASAENQCIQLTPNELWSSGRATYKEPMHLWEKASGRLADFTTHFSFVIDLYGDGFAFFLAPVGSSIPPDSKGGNLGLMSRSQSLNSTKNSFVAVEFDTVNNGAPDRYQDHHVGIDLNSMSSKEMTTWEPSDIKNGKMPARVFISYNSSSKNLSVLLTDGGNVSTLYYVTDLKDYLPEWVTFGFSAATGNQGQVHKIDSWNFSSSLQISNPTAPPPASPVAVPLRDASPGRQKGRSLWVALGVAGGCVLAGLVLFGCWKKRKSREIEEFEEQNRDRAEEEFEKVTGLRMFQFSELVAATNEFAEEGMLGRGGSGSVYKGSLGDTTVAVKRINPESQQGLKEYKSELNSIGRLWHKNLVRLIGWCCENKNLLIVYDFLPNKSLDFHLFQRECELTWERRYKIALDLASALFYLQENCEQCVLHRDIKSANVLLDSEFNAKLGDFGLARLVDHGEGSQTTRLMGTWGYMAPEYFDSGETTKESDIYSFGIVALEIACGRRAIEKVEENGQRVEIKLVEHIWEQYGKGNIFVGADTRLCGNYDKEQMNRLLVVGLSCAHPNYSKRPSIRQVIVMLTSEDPVSELPLEMPMPIHVAPVSLYYTANESVRG